MKTSEFHEKVRSIPRFRARFKLLRVPPWMNDRIYGPERDVEKGEDFLVYLDQDRTMVRASNGHAFSVVPSALRFIGYEPIVKDHPLVAVVSHE